MFKDAFESRFEMFCAVATLVLVIVITIVGFSLGGI